jgi:hypothetical protein
MRERPMAHLKPEDPEGLAAMVAALRAVATGAQGTEFESYAMTQLPALGIDQATAKRMLGRFEKVRPSVRKRALGQFEQGPFARGSRGTDGAGTTLAARAELNPGWSASETGTVAGSPGTPGTSANTGSSVHTRVRSSPFGPGDNLGGTTDGGGTVSDGQGTSTYWIHYVGFHCDEETHLNWLGSDEVYAITSAVWIDPSTPPPTPPLTVHHPFDASGTAYYENVDAGDTRQGPEVACWEGSPTWFPVSLSVVAFEHDEGDPNAYKDDIDKAVKLAVALAIWFFAPGAPAIAVLTAATPLISSGINWLLDTGDDQIGITRTQVFTQEFVDQEGNKEVHPLPGTELYAHVFSEHTGDGAKYQFGFKFVRDPEFNWRENVVIV